MELTSGDTMKVRNLMHDFLPDLTKHENWVVKVDAKLHMEKVKKYVQFKIRLQHLYHFEKILRNKIYF